MPYKRAKIKSNSVKIVKTGVNSDPNINHKEDLAQRRIIGMPKY
jgi:hypothetical protein